MRIRTKSNHYAGLVPAVVSGVALKLSSVGIRYLILYAVLCTAILLHASPVHAQVTDDPRSRAEIEAERENQRRQNVLGLNNTSARLSTSQQSSMALDAPIDPDTYILGPGDLLGISLRGGMGVYYNSVISPEGNLIIPQLPMLKLDGLSLTNAKQMIVESWSNDIGDIPIDISLLQMRQMRVSVGGSVKYPGQYVVTPADRALTLIELAGGLTDEASERHAVLISVTGQRTPVDFLRYRRFGSREVNPLLSAGAHLVVEPVMPADDISFIEVGGAVVFPQTYEWIEGDVVLDVIEVSGGFRSVADQDSILLTRFVEGKPVTEAVDLSNAQYGRGPALQSGDLVYVPHDLSKTPTRASVLVRGEVERPGRYPIMADHTRLLDLLEQAGGMTGDAYLRGSRVWRLRSESSRIMQEIERLDTTEAALIARSDANFLRDYKRSMDRDYVDVDFVELLDGDDQAVAENNIVLVDSLVVNIPRKVYHIRVLGAVERPGVYSFREGWDYKDYIKEAGGYLKEADKRNVRQLDYQGSQFLLARNDLPVYAGDTIFIPEKWLPPFWDVFTQYFAVFLQAATLTVLILTTR
jgi:polysaccharide biosynthesis/export protein